MLESQEFQDRTVTAAVPENSGDKSDDKIRQSKTDVANSRIHLFALLGDGLVRDAKELIRENSGHAKLPKFTAVANIKCSNPENKTYRYLL